MDKVEFMSLDKIMPHMNYVFKIRKALPYFPINDFLIRPLDVKMKEVEETELQPNNTIVTEPLSGNFIEGADPKQVKKEKPLSLQEGIVLTLPDHIKDDNPGYCIGMKVLYAINQSMVFDYYENTVIVRPGGVVARCSNVDELKKYLKEL